ncbi:FHA domain-containing protein [candidate division KSB1 bacterium]|nr:FHA domain-containing protein [candidate division KSB1 bacterium]
MPKFILKRNSETLREFEIDNSKPIYTLGSDSSNDFVISEEQISPKHLKIEYHNGHFYISDLQTKYGVTLNGRPLLSQMQIVDGDEIKLGELSLLFDNHFPTQQQVPSEEEEPEVIDEDYFTRQLSSGSPPETEPPEAGANMSSEQTEAEEFFELGEIGEEPKTQRLESAQVQSPFASSTGRSYGLLAIYGPYIGKKFPLKMGDTKIGRDNTLNDIVIRNNENGVLDPSISRRHVTISYRDGRFYVSDKRSKTRTYVNQTKLEPDDEVPIEEGDEIEIVSDQKSTIFRLLVDEKNDFSPPKKAGIWWIRNNLRLGMVSAVLFGLIAFGTLGVSCVNKIALNKKPSQLKFIEEAWYQNNISSNGGANMNGTTQMSYLAAADLTGDNSVDLVYSVPSKGLVALNGVTKKPIWKLERLQGAHSIPIVLSDLNANGLQDVLVVGQDSRLRALDGSSGAEIWLSPILGERISGLPVITDLNGDGLKDVLACTPSGQVHLGYSYVNDIDWRTIETGSSIESVPSSMDLDDDGSTETFIGTDEGKLLIIDGTAGKVARVYDFNEEVSKASGDTYLEHSIRFPVTFADLDNDEVTDLLISATNGNYLAVQSNTLSKVWHERLPFGAEDTSEKLAPSTGHLDDDEHEDAVLVSTQMIKVIRGTNDPESARKTLWKYELTDDTFNTPISLADFNKDGFTDVIIASRSGRLYVFDGTTGKILTQVHSSNNPVMSPLVVADLGEDGQLDIVFIRSDYNIYKIQTNSRIDKNSVVWGQTYSNHEHTGRYDYVKPRSPVYNVLTATCGLLFLGFAGLTVYGRKNRMQLIQKNQRSGHNGMQRS